MSESHGTGKQHANISATVIGHFSAESTSQYRVLRVLTADIHTYWDLLDTSPTNQVKESQLANKKMTRRSQHPRVCHDPRRQCFYVPRNLDL